MKNCAWLFCFIVIPFVLAIEIVKSELLGEAGFWYLMSSSSSNNRGRGGAGEGEVGEI